MGGAPFAREENQPDGADRQKQAATPQRSLKALCERVSFPMPLFPRSPKQAIKIQRYAANESSMEGTRSETATSESME
ncbi:MAG: hypothetical protein ACLUE1_00980 [Adlercreutzia equolifaciens]